MTRLAAVLALAGLLAACGLKGPLERPEPLFGQRGGDRDVVEPLNPAMDFVEEEPLVFPETVEEDPFEDLLTDEERETRDGT